MSTPVTDRFTNDKYTQIRGDLRAILARGDQLLIASVHPEGQATALYRLNLDTGELVAGALPAGGVALAADDAHVYLAGSDGQVYKAGIDKGEPRPLGPVFDPPPVALACVAGGRLAVVAGKQLVILARKDGKELQRIELSEFGAVIASDPAGEWLVVGGDRGTLSVFDCENKEAFYAGESKKLHEGAITALCFEPDELRVMSTAVDHKLLLTHVRGDLDPEDRSGKNGHGDRTTAIVNGPGDRFYTSGLDSQIKAWVRGAGQRKPAAQKEGLAKVTGLALGQYKGKDHLVAACIDNTLRLFPLDAEAKLGDRELIYYGAQQWAEYELKRRDPKLREIALRALAGWNDARSLEALAQRVSQDDDHGLKVLATELLGASGSPRAIKLLEPLLRAGDEAVRLAALTGLLELEGKDSLRIFDLALAVGKRDIGTATITALTQLARADDLAFTRLVGALSGQPREVRVAALAALEDLHDAASPEAELVALRATQADIRKTALVRFYQRKMLALPEVQAALRRFSADPDAGVRQAAFLISLLARPTLAAALRCRDKQLHRQLHDIETARSPVDEVKAAVAEAKAVASDRSKGTGAKGKVEDDLPKPKTVPLSELEEADKRPLLEAMASRALDTCVAGAAALASLQDPRALGTLLQLSRESTASVRVETCKALAELGDPRGGARLRLMLRDGDASVRDAAFSALAGLGDGGPLAVAEAGLYAEHEDVRRRGLDLLLKQIKKAGKAKEDPRAIALLERALNDAGKTVRTEAFKAALSLEIGGGGADSLRFVLRSIHADVRREILNEVMGQISQSWAWPLLLELLADPDPSLRKDALEFALKRTKGIGAEPLSVALAGKWVDLRVEAVKVLARRKAPGTHDLLVKAIADDDEAVRQLAVDALLTGDGEEALPAALASKHPDVVVRAACALAVHGDSSVRAPLQAMIEAPEPEVPALRGKWQARVVRALGGLAELGDPTASSAVLPLLQHKDGEIRQAATTALAWMARPDNANAVFALQAALQHADPAVRTEAALGLAFIGDPSGASLIFTPGKTAPPPIEALLAALALGNEDLLVSFLDHGDDKLQGRALLLLMLRELVEGDGVPDRCLAALASAHPRVRLLAAQALESFGDDPAFAKFVTDLFNDRGEGRAKWTFGGPQVRALAELATFGDSQQNPQLKVRAARLLEALHEDKQEGLDRQWAAFSKRFAKPLAAAKEQAAGRGAPKLAYGPGELRQVVFGAYAALSRLPGGPAETRIRQTALARVLALAAGTNNKSKKTGSSEHVAAAISVLVLALGDTQASIRRQAFDGLGALGVDTTTLAAEALATGQSDTGSWGLALLSQEGSAAAGLKVLEETLLQRDDGLEQEAAKLLAEKQSKVRPGTPEAESEAGQKARREAWIFVHTLSLTARAEKLRLAGVAGLAGSYEPKNAAAKALRGALTSKYRAVRFAAALQLAAHKDAAAFDVLVEMLRSDQASEQNAAISALQRLGDGRAAQAFLDRIDRDPAGTARVDALLAAAGGFHQVADVPRILAHVDNPKRRAAAFAALLAISGHDQRIEDPEDAGPQSPSSLRDAGLDDDDDDDDIDDDIDDDDDDEVAAAPRVAYWESKQRPRNDGVLVQIAEAARRLSDDRTLQNLLPGLRWARGHEVDAALAPLWTYPKPELAARATEAIGWRLRKRTGPAEPLLAAVKASDPLVSFIAAEGLALGGRGEGSSVLLTSVDLQPDLDIRRRAVRALGALADIRALDTLLRLVSDDGHALQEEAAEALGHMGAAAEAQPGQPRRIFGILKKLSEGTGGVARRALIGLRHFNTGEAWDLIRGRVEDPDPGLRQTVAALLEHCPEPTTAELLTARLGVERHAAVAQALAFSLRKHHGPDSLEPDYALVLSYHGPQGPELLGRLRDRGDPARLFSLLPALRRQDLYLGPLVQILTNRDPLPIDAAAPHLGLAHPRTAMVAAQVIGRAGAAASKHKTALVAATRAYREAWLAEYRRQVHGEAHRTAELEAPYLALLWACARLDVGGDELVAAASLAADGTAHAAHGRKIRRQAVIDLASGAGGKAGAAALEAVLAGSDGELRTLAAAGLSQRQGDAALLAAAVLDDADPLARLLSAGAGGARAALRGAAGDVHRQGVVLRWLVKQGDVEGMVKALADKRASETARLALVEALGEVAEPSAIAALSAIGADAQEDEELRKAAHRARRRAKRAQAAASTPKIRRSRWEVSL